MVCFCGCRVKFLDVQWSWLANAGGLLWRTTRFVEQAPWAEEGMRMVAERKSRVLKCQGCQLSHSSSGLEAPLAKIWLLLRSLQSSSCLKEMRCYWEKPFWHCEWCRIREHLLQVWLCHHGPNPPCVQRCSSELWPHGPSNSRREITVASSLQPVWPG